MNRGDSPQVFTREQKIGFVLLFVFALLTLGLGGLQMRNTIYGPFVIRLEPGGIASAEADEETRLRSADTDHDGLSDFDELNTYQTSPYLPDSDSDGKSDSEEITNGTNPNCAEGRACVNAETQVASSTSPGFAPPILPDSVRNILPPDNATATSSGALPDGSAGLESLLANPAALRAELLATGRISQEILDRIDDATLIRMIRNSLNNQQTR